jgi:hypothetical protein
MWNGSRTSRATSSALPIQSNEDVRGFQLHLTSRGAGVPKINTISALRFFFKVTLDRPVASVVFRRTSRRARGDGTRTLFGRYTQSRVGRLSIPSQGIYGNGINGSNVLQNLPAAAPLLGGCYNCELPLDPR